MDEKIKEFVKRAGVFSEEDEKLLLQELRFRKIAKGDILLQKGKVCSSLCFVVSGSFFQYNLNQNLDKNIINLYTRYDWVIDHKSFSSRKPSEHTIEAFEVTSFYDISIEAIHRLIAKSQAFLQMGKILDDSTQRVEFYDKNFTPDEKYNHLLKNRPQLFQTFPQTIIASFLKITPETLSRVRRRLS